MEEAWVWALVGIMTVCVVSFVGVEFMLKGMEDRLKTSLKTDLREMEKATTTKINSVKNELEKEYINNINAVRDEMNEKEIRFNKDLKKVADNIQVFSTEADKKIIEIETLIEEKENNYKKEMSSVREEMLILLMKNEISQSTMRAEFKLSLQKLNNRCMNSINRMKTEIRPAFAATFTNERAMPLSHGEILKFDSVNLNIGEGYDSTTGYFTVPKAGIYFVSCTIRSIENKHISAYLWKNNKKLVLAYGRNWNTGSFGLPVSLQKGDILFVRHDDGPYIVNEEVHGGSSSFFAATFINNLHSEYKRIYSSTEDIKFNSTLSKFSSETEENLLINRRH